MAKNLVIIQNNQTLTTSLKIAEVFEKNHRDVLRDVRDLINQMKGMRKKSQTPMFQASTYIHEQNGQTYPMFYLNRDGFTLLAMGFTSEKALKFKLKYINAFNKMEEKLNQLLAEGKDARWIETREHGTLTRKSETSVIKDFIAYARSQGFVGVDKEIYRKFTIWANIIAGLPMRNGRDNATIHQMNIVDMTENGIRNILINGMADGLHYTRIVAQVGKWLDDFRKISFVDTYFNTIPLISKL